MSNRKYTQDEVEKIFLDNGLIVKDIYKSNKVNMYCEDLDGYKYSKNLPDMLRKSIPHKFHKLNPFTIENIKLYLYLNSSTLKLLDSKYNGTENLMTWQCECGTILQTTWSCVLRGKRFCNFCSKSKRFDNYKDYTSEVFEECSKRNYTLITKYIHRGRDKFEYICNKHKDSGVKTSTYDQMVSSGQGCYECGVEMRSIKHRLDESKLISLVESKGLIYDGYDYDNEGKKDKKVNIHIICPKHIEKGVQKMKYNNLLNSKGNCLYCIGYGRTQIDLQNELDEMHGLVTILEYVDYATPLKAKCNICGYEWNTNGVNLTQGHRCPNCPKSNFETEVGNLLDRWGYIHTDQIWFNECRDKNPLPFDFYLDDFNIIIEVDGEGHYRPIRWGSSMTELDALQNLENTQYHDKLKTEYCKKNNIPLIRVPYWERDNLEYYLFDELVKYGAIEKIA